MFPRKKADPPKKRQHDLSQFGLMEIPDDFDPAAGYGDDGADSDLEAELAAIVGGKQKPKTKLKPNIVSTTALDKMVAESMKDISDDDNYDDSNDENDPDLLGELQIIAGDEGEELRDEQPTANSVDSDAPELFLPTSTVDTITIIRQRLEMYKQAEEHAKSSGDAAKARRFGRGIKTLNDLLNKASVGKVINVDDIPPEVTVKAADKNQELVNIEEKSDTPKVPLRTAPPPPDDLPKKNEEKENVLKSPKEESAKPINPMVEQMKSRQQEYKAAALQSKRSGDTATALQFLKVVKQFDVVMKMYEDGQEVDLSDMPPAPAEFLEFLAKMQDAKENVEVTEPAEEPSKADIQKNVSSTNMLEALQQRLDKYKSVEEAAKSENNAGKARRFGRIVKQYEEAIKNYKKGQSISYDELPVPPGFGPLPTIDLGSPKPDTVTIGSVASPTTEPTSPSSSLTKTTNTTPSENITPTGTPATNRHSPLSHDLTTRTSGNQQKNNLAEQQMKILLERQKEFKTAAIEAKKAGEIEQAKEYLKIFKGFDALLNAASSGLPVDLNTLPVPPSQRENLEASFAIVTTDDCDPDVDISEIGVRIEEQLAKQLMMCKNTRDHHKAMGDIAGMNRFENLALTVQKDLDLIRYCKRKNFPLPKFHYEKRSFNIVHCNTDLTDNELEIVIVRGINYNVPNPKEVDTYIKVEFPLLNDEIYKTKTTLVKDTDSPDYNQRFIVEIQRGNRQFQRIFKRHGVKFEVYSRGCSINCCGLSRLLPSCCFRGFLRSDILIGTVQVKLQSLETKCDIHDTYNLMDGRKALGGKLEIKLRVRNPILTKQMEHIDEKWLLLDS